MHYYILCLCAKGQTKNLKGLQRENKKPEGFAKQKKSAKFAMRYASQLAVHHSSQIDNEPLIIVVFLRDTRQKNFATRSVSVHHSDIPHFATFNPTQNIATFTIHIVSLQTLRLTRHRNLRYLAPRILRLNMYHKPHHRFSQKVSFGGRIASCDVR